MCRTIYLCISPAASSTTRNFVRYVLGPDGQPHSAGAPPASAALIAGLMDTLHRMSAPKRARKLADGSWVTEHVQ